MKFGAEKIGVQAEMVGSRVWAVFSRLPLSWGGVGALIVGVLLARWTWILLAPHSLAVLPAKTETGGKASGTFFGTAAASGVAASNGDGVLGNVRLIGVFSGKYGFAVIKTDEKTQRGVALGEDVVKGTKLVEVDADHVILEHNGVRQQVNLENKSTNNKGIALEHPTSISGVDQAVAGWNQAQQEMHNPGRVPNIQKLPNAHRP